MVKDFLESMWAPYPCQGLSYVEMDGLENDYPKIFPAGTSFFFFYCFFFLNYLCTFINFFLVHTLSQLILWCYFDRKSSSPRKLLWGPMWDTHNKASCAHTGCWDWVGNQKQQLGWEIISCQERLDFDLTAGSKSQELSWKVLISVPAWPTH